jgi:hypothetical protein
MQFTLFEIETALNQLWETYQGLRNLEVLTTIEYLSDYSNWTFAEIYLMYLDN